MEAQASNIFLSIWNH